MAAQTNARDKARQHAEEDARVVLAKHPCVTIGVGECSDGRPGPVDLQPESERRLAHEDKDVGVGQDVAGAGGS